MELVHLDEHVPGVRCHARYACSDNLTGAPVDGYLADRVVATPALCAALRQVQAAAGRHGLGLLVWDAYRPQRAVEAFLRWSQQPEDETAKQRHHPRVHRSELFALGYLARRSAHSRGGAVDLTLCELAFGEPLAMGGDHDLSDPVSHHGAAGIDPADAANRRHLRALMEAGGFVAYEREWWHYTLRDEPHPDSYADVPVT